MIFKKFKFFLESNNEFKYRFIDNIIDSEINKSKDFGLEIEDFDIQSERIFFHENIIPIWDDISKYNDVQYAQKISEITKEAHNNLRLEYYFNKLKNENKPVKTGYNLHISSIISQLFMRISNNLFD